MSLKRDTDFKLLRGASILIYHQPHIVLFNKLERRSNLY